MLINETGTLECSQAFRFCLGTEMVEKVLITANFRGVLKIGVC
jgi:hypothetical protein